MLEYLLTKLFQHICFPVNIIKFLRTPIFKNICERLLLIVVFNSNEEQHLLAILDEVRYNYVQKQPPEVFCKNKCF